MMAKSKEEQQALIQEKIEHLLRHNPSKSYSKEEIIICYHLIYLPKIKLKEY
jgi:hypothetical protein